MPERAVRCCVCGETLTYEDELPRGSTCGDCGAYLRCCRNCRFFDESAYNECGEPSAERVVEKGASNFCGYFEPAAGASGARGHQGSGTREDLEKLFKN